MNIPKYLADNKELANAIRSGYLDEYDENWERSFVGIYAMKHPNQIKCLNDMRTATGKKIPSWADLTDTNLKSWRRIILARVCPNSAALYFRQMCAIITDNRNEVEIPSQRYREILHTRTEPSQNIFITSKELKRIHEYQPKTVNGKYVKRIFMISALTGCRHSDAERLTVDDIDESTNTLRYVSQKTRMEAEVPVHVWLREYLSQTVERTRKCQMHVSTFNAICQKICRACKISTPVKIYHGGKLMTGEKWQFVTSHTARRSFCTNLFHADLDLLTISRLAGHSTVEMTSRYVIGTKELPSSAQSFFNGK